MLIVDTADSDSTGSLGGRGSLLSGSVIDSVVMFSVAFGLMRLAGIPEVVAITVAISRTLGITPPAPDLELDDTAEDDITRPPYSDGPRPYWHSPASTRLWIPRPWCYPSSAGRC